VACRLAELLTPLSLLADLGAGLPAETGLRVAVLGVGLADKLGLSEIDRAAVYYAGLLRHLGCSTTAHEETVLMGDERELRESFNPIDSASPRQMLQAARKGWGKSVGRLEKARRVARFLVKGPKEAPRIFAARCEVAVRLAERLGLDPATRAALDDAFERFDGKGVPRRRKGTAVAAPARILVVAELAAMFAAMPGGASLARDMVVARTGGQVDPDVAAAFLDAREELLGALRAPAMLVPALAAEPGVHRVVGGEVEEAVALVLADFVDMKSPFTLGHSRGVASLARAAAGALGLSPTEQVAVYRAGLLHDLGRLGVSNAIWDKPGALDAGERELVREHVRHTERVLALAPPWRDLAVLAASDHERPDGHGYPRGAPAAGAGIAARVLAAADVYSALTEPRAHRPAHMPGRAAEIVAEAAATGQLDRACANAVLAAAGQLRPTTRTAWPNGLTTREVAILRQLARGHVDKQIAETLGISHRTVHHHNASIYAKLGVATRGAAALFAVEHDLLSTSLLD